MEYWKSGRLKCRQDLQDYQDWTKTSSHTRSSAEADSLETTGFTELKIPVFPWFKPRIIIFSVCSATLATLRSGREIVFFVFSPAPWNALVSNIPLGCFRDSFFCSEHRSKSLEQGAQLFPSSNPISDSALWYLPLLFCLRAGRWKEPDIFCLFWTSRSGDAWVLVARY